MSRYPKLRNLVLSGGGLLGFSYIGFLRYLEDNNLLKQIKTITGSSVGAIFATFFIIGCKANELQSFYSSIVLSDYVKINTESFLNFPKLKGLENGNRIMSVFNNFLTIKTGSSDITFLELYSRYNIILQVGVTNLTKYRFEIFNHITKPNTPVKLVVRASIAIPFFLEPIIIDGDLYCDGGLLENLPIDAIYDIISDKSIEKTETEPDIQIETLGICLVNTIKTLDGNNYQDSTISEYFSVIMHTLSMAYFNNKQRIENNSKNKIILLEIPCDIMTFVKINATASDLNNIIEIAYNSIQKELDNK